MHLGIGNYDWVSFLIEADADAFQLHYLEEWNQIVVNRIPEPERRKKSRVHALGATKGGRRRYTLAVWGEYAALVKNLPFAKWADHLTRVDVRTKLYDCRPDTFERLCIALENAETKNNVESFKVAKRQKNHQRDSGGRGVRYGSRKSDVSSKVYKRGNEIPAFETQFQDDKLDAVVLGNLELAGELGSDAASWGGLLLNLQALQRRHIDHWLFQAAIDHSIEGLSHEMIPMPKHLRETYQQELWGEPQPTPEDDKAYTALLAGPALTED